MKIKFVIGLLLLSAATTGQAQDTQTKESRRQQKKQEASEKAAKADVLIQKNEIYDKQVLESQQPSAVTDHKNMNHVHSRPHFHKRKLRHRLRRRRG